MQSVPTMSCGDGITRASNGALFAYPPVKVTANKQLTKFDTGKLVCNPGATGPVIVGLPFPPTYGLWFQFSISVAQSLGIQATGGVTIGGGAANNTLSNAVLGSNALVYADGANWFISPGQGAWA